MKIIYLLGILITTINILVMGYHSWQLYQINIVINTVKETLKEYANILNDIHAIVFGGIVDKSKLVYKNTKHLINKYKERNKDIIPTAPFNNIYQQIKKKWTEKLDNKPEKKEQVAKTAKETLKESAN